MNPPQRNVRRQAFTVATLFRQRLHVQQFLAQDPLDACARWAQSSATRRTWAASTFEIWAPAHPINGTPGVWCVTASRRIGTGFLWLDVVRTVATPHPRKAPRELFSVVVHYMRGTYIGQYKADGARDAVLRWTRSAYAVKTWGAKAFDIEAVATPVPRSAGAWMIRGKGRASGRPARIIVVRTADSRITGR